MAKTISELATEAVRYLKRDSERDIVLPTDGAPEWFTDLCRTAHDNGRMFPDDWRYEFIQDALNAIEDGQETDAAVDLDSLYPYTADRLKWLASRIDRTGYCDEAMQDYGQPETTEHLIAWGMQRELQEVFDTVYQFLTERAEETEEEEAEAAE